MLIQTPEQNQILSVEIGRMITQDLKTDVKYYIHRYGKILDQKLGMTTDDIMNDIREQVWKGLLTWRKDGKANKKTYVVNLISKRFFTLLKKTAAEKNNSVLYFADVASSIGSSTRKEHLETHETGETLLLRRQELMRDMDSLSDMERMIYPDLLQGSNIEDISEKYNLERHKIVGAINSIHERLSERRHNTNKGILC